MEDEITKEIKTISEIATTPEERSIEVLEDEQQSVEEMPVQNQQKKKKKIWMIGGIAAGALLLVILVIVLIPKKGSQTTQLKVAENNDSKFASTIKKSLESGDFDRALKEGLKEHDIEATSVCLLRMDLDSDGDQGLVAYAEGSNKKVLIQLEVDGHVFYDDSYPLDAKDSLGYVYSSEKEENFWYTEHEKNYTIISSAKKIIKEEDFLSEFFPLTKTYQQKPILSSCLDYSFNKKLDVEKLEKNVLTEELLLKDNNMKKEDIKEAYKKYLETKAEEEKKKQEEEEQKKKEEEEQRKLAGSLNIGERSYKYGAYKLYTSENAEDGVMYLYSDGTCIYKDVDCKYQVGEVRNETDDLVPGITLNNGKSFINSSTEDTLVEPKESIQAKYEG